MRSGSILVGAFIATTVLAAAACSFTVAGVQVSIGQDDMGVGDLAADATVTVDLSELCSPQGPTSACTADGNLLACKGTVPAATPCVDGCSSEGQPHCRRLDPGGVAEPSDYELPGLADIVLTQDAVLNTDTGEITATPFERVGGSGVISGVGFRSASQGNGAGSVGIFSFGSLTLATGKTLFVVGGSPVSLVAARDLVIGGIIDVQGTCGTGGAVAGGGAGGPPTPSNGVPGGGTGGGGGGQGTMLTGGGGGGGGGGDVGGLGAGVNSNGNAGGAAGPIFGDLSIADPVLRGGGGGGAGGGGGTMAGGGGGGGGFVQVAANGQVTLSNGSSVIAGGCHGASGKGTGGGGGGGAGGGILVEARQVAIEVGVHLTANGGGGGGGGDGSDGDDGPTDEAQATGGAGGTGMNHGTNGGAGGHTSALFGGAGTAPMVPDKYGGGGGGAVGRIAIKTKNGMPSMTGVIFSPKINETSAGHPAPAQFGLVQFK